MAPKDIHPQVSPAALREMFAHAMDAYPEECCGVLYGAPTDSTPSGEPVADSVERARNMQNELHAQDPETFKRDARSAYNLEPKALFKLQKSLRPDAPSVARIIYHSHPDVGAYFSDEDQAAAQFDGEPLYPVEYLVVDAQKDGAKEAAQFDWDPEERRYVEIRRYKL